MEVDFFIKRAIYDYVGDPIHREKVDEVFMHVDEEFFEYFIKHLDEGLYHKCVTCEFEFGVTTVTLDMDKYFKLFGVTFVRDHIDPNYQSNI